MIYEISQRFFFDSAHFLERQINDLEEIKSSRRIHGHTYYAEIALSGNVNPQTGMVQDLGQLRAAIALLRDQLDHHLLNEIPNLGAPTLENLCTFIAKALQKDFPTLSCVRVWREAVGDSCTLRF